jgi:hypothetical protein
MRWCVANIGMVIGLCQRVFELQNSRRRSDGRTLQTAC